MIVDKRKLKKFLLAAVLMMVLAIYLFRLTYSGLWYDEGVEYFYSKYMSGPLPTGMQTIGHGMSNMYQRICSTYQPPLFNVLMYFWLLIADNESWFRLAGVLTTFVGAVGLYAAMKRLSNFWWALAGVVVFLATPSVHHYALECGEYNLMVCMECWALYFFCSALKDNDLRRQKRYLAGFLIFACLAAYSQYGAILLMMALYLVLLAFFLHAGNQAALHFLAIGTLVVILIAALPLVGFFLMPQMANQQGGDVSHAPVFVLGVAYSLLRGIYKINFFIFDKGREGTIYVTLVITFIAAVAFFLKDKAFKVLFSSVILTYFVYFVLVACSYYAYNDWDGSLGCNNQGGRYTLFMAPLVVLTGVYSFYVCASRCKMKPVSVSLMVLFMMIFLFYANQGFRKFVYDPDVKEHTREAYKVWMEHGGDNNYTMVDIVRNPAFQYYYQHGKRRNPANVIIEHVVDPKRPVEEVTNQLDGMKVFRHQNVYYLSTQYYLGQGKRMNHLDKAMQERGYEAKILYQYGEVLIVYSRNNVSTTSTKE